MNIFVGSTNPVKINAVVVAISETFPECIVTGIDVKSGVSTQPRSDDETRKGALNRAQAALDSASIDQKNSDKNSLLGIGLEGGVFEAENGELWSTVWVCVITIDGQTFESCGALYKIPESIAQGITKGEDMGSVIDTMVGAANIKQNQGTIGVITKNFIDRTEEYTIIAKMALGLWYGRNWEKELQTNTT